MPYKSASQQAWAHTPAGTKALGGKAKVAEWDSASKGKKLPQHVAKAKPAGSVGREVERRLSAKDK